MNSYLLYSDTDRLYADPYFDGESIVQDLGLKALFLAAAKEVIYENDRVKCVSKEDPYIQDTMRRVMLIPLGSEEEIRYRQGVMADCLENEELIRRLYGISGAVLSEWNNLGRNVRVQMSGGDTASRLCMDIHVISLFVNNLREIKDLLEEHREKLKSQGMRSLLDRLNTEFSEEQEQFVRKILRSISFYTGSAEEEEPGKKVVRPRIVLECGLENGLKLSSIRIQEVASESQKCYRPGSTMSKIQEYKNSRIPDSFSTVKDSVFKAQAEMLETEIVSFLVGSLDPFMRAFDHFFDYLHLQSAFYVGAVNLKHQMARYGITGCFPGVCESDRLCFRELKEFAMCLEQRMEAVANTCSLEHKMLLIVTGANQGGKSTFLRSIGIAQVMMQCGMQVAAQKYESGIFPNLFTHFTRREDSEMNSGRLDEELKRMNQIIENLGERSLILLNESFATTTEKEGSVIAYDIIRALNEKGVKILTVTHLLSFAQRMYRESSEDPNTDVEFFSAERKENGVRTFKMIQHAPELTSFGLDLYEEIVEKKKRNA